MENIESRLSSNAETLFTSQSARLKPAVSRNGAFEDLGNSFSRTSPKTLGKTNRPRKLPISTPTEFCSSSSGSEDGLDCLSQQSKADEMVVVKQIGKEKSHSNYDPAVLLEKELNIKSLPKISKIKSASKSQDDKSRKSSPPPPSSSMKIRGKAKTPPHKADNSQSHSRTRADIKKSREGASDLTTVTTRPKPRPRPRPRPPPPPPLIERLSPPNEDDLTLSLDATRATQLIQTPSEFPLLSPLSKPTSRDPCSNSLNNIGEASSFQNRTPSSLYTPGRPSPQHAPLRLRDSPTSPALDFSEVKRNNVPIAKSFPAISPMLKDRVVEEFPLSPLSRQSRRKPRTRLKSGGPGPAPFPMSTQELKCISVSSANECRSDKDYAYKHRHQRVVEASGMESDLYEEDDSLFMAPGVDPETLCPYCDSPLPTSPTPFFQELLRTTSINSTPDPRSTNPLGRKAPLSTFVIVCQRHEFESEVLPEAEAKGWPRTINWEALGSRINKMRSELDGIIKDSGEADLLFLMRKLEEGGSESRTVDYAGKGPRIRCVFWREAMESVVQRGVRAMADVRGQFLDFEKSQPGYYGELGSMIIQQTLFNMFPLDSLDPKLIVPFTKNDFIQRILVPEVALRLIMEDRGLRGPTGTEAALLVLRDSTAYGVAMFPEDTGENVSAAGSGTKKTSQANTVGIGDRIVMERARKRRNEIRNDKDLKSLFEGGNDNKTEKLGRKEKESVLAGYDDDNSDTTGGIQVQGPNLDHEKSRSQKSSKKKRNAVHDDDVRSINSKSDGNDSELSLRSDRPPARTRSQRSYKSSKYTDVFNDSDNDGPGFTYHKCSQSKTRKERPSQASYRSLSASGLQRLDSPSASEWERNIRPPKEKLYSGIRSSDLSDMEICSNDDDYKSRARKAEPKMKASTGPTKRYQSSRKKEREYVPEKCLDLESHTPTPKRCFGQVSGGENDPTPRARSKNSGPAASTQSKSRKQSVLALARARIQDDPDGTGGVQPLAGKNKKSKSKVSKSDSWKYNYRSEFPESTRRNNNSSSESQCAGTEVTTERGSDASDFNWLLDDP